MLRFYSCSERDYKKEWEAEYNAIVINRISSSLLCNCYAEKAKKLIWMLNSLSFLHIHWLI